MASHSAKSTGPIGRWQIVSTIVAVAAFLLAYYRVLGESRDYGQYESFFQLVRSLGLTVFDLTRFEAGFVVMAAVLTKFVPSDITVYSLFVAFAMWLKAAAVYRVPTRAGIFFATILFYFVRYFPLYELTQLRAAMAAAFLIWALLLSSNGQRLYGLLACAIAVSFHFSAIAVVPFIFGAPTRRWLVVLIGVVVFGIAVLGTKALVSALGDAIRVASMYATLGFGDLPPNPLSVGLLLDWAMIFVGLAIWPSLSPLMRQVLLIQIVGMAMFYGALDFAVVAHRLRELASVMWLLFVADGLHQRRIVRQCSVAFIVACICLYGYLFVFSGQFFV